MRAALAGVRRFGAPPLDHPGLRTTGRFERNGPDPSGPIGFRAFFAELSSLSLASIPLLA